MFTGRELVLLKYQPEDALRLNKILIVKAIVLAYKVENFLG
jgi:hypothetical protein